MAGYTQKWKCRICKEAQDTDCTPKSQTCDKCIDALAWTLCKETLNLDLTTPGIDRSYWRDQARKYIVVLMRRWKPLPTIIETNVKGA